MEPTRRFEKSLDDLYSIQPKQLRSHYRSYRRKAVGVAKQLRKLRLKMDVLRRSLERHDEVRCVPWPVVWREQLHEALASASDKIDEVVAVAAVAIDMQFTYECASARVPATLPPEPRVVTPVISYSPDAPTARQFISEVTVQINKRPA